MSLPVTLSVDRNLRHLSGHPLQAHTLGHMGEEGELILIDV